MRRLGERSESKKQSHPARAAERDEWHATPPPVHSRRPAALGNSRSRSSGQPRARRCVPRKQRHPARAAERVRRRATCGAKEEIEPADANPAHNEAKRSQLEAGKNRVGAMEMRFFSSGRARAVAERSQRDAAGGCDLRRQILPLRYAARLRNCLTLARTFQEPPMSLIPPHGGKLIDRVVKAGQAETLKQEASKLPAIQLSPREPSRQPSPGAAGEGEGV